MPCNLVGGALSTAPDCMCGLLGGINGRGGPPNLGGGIPGGGPGGKPIRGGNPGPSNGGGGGAWSGGAVIKPVGGGPGGGPGGTRLPSPSSSSLSEPVSLLSSPLSLSVERSSSE